MKDANAECRKSERARNCFQSTIHITFSIIKHLIFFFFLSFCYRDFMCCSQRGVRMCLRVWVCVAVCSADICSFELPKRKYQRLLYTEIEVFFFSRMKWIERQRGHSLRHCHGLFWICHHFASFSLQDKERVFRYGRCMWERDRVRDK